jgi:ornithine cyclodeaminase
MLYADDRIIHQVGINWEQLLSLIKKAVSIMNEGNYSQPIKPYLRYNNPKNRIIAMPAYVGGEIGIAGIKWIASFPDNIHVKLPRAHCMIIINDSTTGVPLAVFNSTLISILRTVSVSGSILREYVKGKDGKLNVGIIGWGPIGQYHYRLINEHFREKIGRVFLFDSKPIENIDNVQEFKYIETIISPSWETLYKASNIIITCTVSEAPYIDLEPPKGGLLLNVSLRDYKSSIYNWVKNSIIVDDWDEVCRENTDIENIHKEFGLTKTDTINMHDYLFGNKFTHKDDSSPIMFNPMGLAVFDMIISYHYYQKLLDIGLGIEL